MQKQIATPDKRGHDLHGRRGVHTIAPGGRLLLDANGSNVIPRRAHAEHDASVHLRWHDHLLERSFCQPFAIECWAILS